MADLRRRISTTAFAIAFVAAAASVWWWVRRLWIEHDLETTRDLARKGGMEPVFRMGVVPAVWPAVGLASVAVGALVVALWARGRGATHPAR